MKFDSVVFDLDGTLWDTTAACAVGWNNVLARRGIEFRPIVAEDVRRVTGKPHDECIRVTFEGLPADEIHALIEETATEDVVVIERMGGELYPGVAEGLSRLWDDHRLLIVSNCQSGYIETFLRLSGLAHLFDDFECFGNTRRSKAENLQAVIDRNRLERPVMVGDAEGDEVAARACAIPFHFVEYGFGACTVPDRRCESFSAVVEAILGS